jgi:hypothetical protein
MPLDPLERRRVLDTLRRAGETALATKLADEFDVRALEQAANDLTAATDAAVYDLLINNAEKVVDMADSLARGLGHFTAVVRDGQTPPPAAIDAAGRALLTWQEARAQIVKLHRNVREGHAKLHPDDS